jgi:hypothetical protein
VNIIALFIRNAESLSLFATFIVCFTVTPSFFSYVESPKFLFKKGKLTQLLKAMAYISKMNNTGLTEKELSDPLFQGGAGYAAIEGKTVRVDVRAKTEKSSNPLNDFKTIVTNFKYIFFP